MAEYGKWSPVEGNIVSRWAKQIDPDNVLPEYPRPQMVRKAWMNLNGLWDYAIRPETDAADETRIDGAAGDYDGRILVPFAIESALSGVKKQLLPDQRLWYRRFFSVPEEWRKGKVLIHFGAVDWKAEIWINGQKAGEHTGGFYPFEFEVSALLNHDENEIVVKVWDPTDVYGQERGKQVLKPGGIFYTPVSGIWQTVWLEPVPVGYIKSLKLTPDIDSEELIVGVESSGDIGNMMIEAAAYDGSKIVGDAIREKVNKSSDSNSDSGTGTVRTELRLKITEPKLWSPDMPFLYDLQIRLLNEADEVAADELAEDKAVADEVVSYFGMRKFSTGKDDRGISRLMLNNKPFFQNGVLDQGYWPDGLYTAPTDEALIYDLEVTRKLGFSMTRKHIKVEPARWYYHCDRLGLIVWQDMINGGGKFNVLQHTVKPMLFGRFRFSDGKYSGAGRADHANRENYRKELKEMLDALYNCPCIGMWVPFNEGWGQFDASKIADQVKKYDPTRCVDHASGWYDQGGGDVKSIHTYFTRLKMPDDVDERPVVISEFGGYSLSVKGHVWRKDREFGYKKFTSIQELKAECALLYRDQLKPLLSKGVSASVYTQLTDVETETNGLLTYDREMIKIDLNFEDLLCDKRDI